jgi:hypothetical protein
MTVGIAAICHEEGEPRIALCGDSLVSTDITSAETAYKLDILAPSPMAALWAGTIPEVMEVLGLYRYASLPPLHTITAPDLQEQLRVPIRTRKARKIEHLVQCRIALSYADFLERKESIRDPTWDRLAEEIERLYIDAQLLLVGFGLGGQVHPFWRSSKTCPFVYKVDQEDVSPYGDFACIGAGSLAAAQALSRRGQAPTTTLTQTLYNISEAKKFSEQAPSVGKDLTTLAVMSPPRSDGKPPSLQGITPAGQKFLRSSYGRYGPKVIKDWKIPPGLEMLSPLNE